MRLRCQVKGINGFAFYIHIFRVSFTLQSDQKLMGNMIVAQSFNIIFRFKRTFNFFYYLLHDGAEAIHVAIAFDGLVIAIYQLNAFKVTFT
ncbi:MAG: hypothetical protein Roseis2KO_04500 [Roseivirga sp.]